MTEIERLLAEMLNEQRQTNVLLAALIDALADDDADEIPQRRVDLDGNPY